MTDVARLAGVSTATVSAVINNSTRGNIRVSAETRQRVLNVVAQLGYVAHPAARSLAGGKNRILGIFTYQPIFPFQHHDFFYPFLVGIEEEAEALGYQLLIFTNVTDENGSRSIYHGDTNLLYMADGSILLGMFENKDDLRRLQEEGYPFVYVGRREVPGAQILYTAADYPTAVFELTNRLVALGHQRIACIGYPDQIEPLVDREAGFRAACLQHGLPCDSAILRISADEINPEWTTQLISDGFTAALVEYDNQAQALLHSLNAMNLVVPHDFSIAMLGDPHYQWDNSPDWTMFTIPRREMGVEAVRLLVQRLDHPTETMARTISLPCRIVPGQTISAPAFRQKLRKEVPVPESETSA